MINSKSEKNEGRETGKKKTFLMMQMTSENTFELLQNVTGPSPLC